MDELDDVLAEEMLVEEMVSYRKNVTGVRNTVFISPKGFTRHGPRIKVAINPPDSLNPTSETASIDIATGSVAAGTIDDALLGQVREFIDLNRDTLLAYWNYEIDADELRKHWRARH